MTARFLTPPPGHVGYGESRNQPACNCQPTWRPADFIAPAIATAAPGDRGSIDRPGDNWPHQTLTDPLARPSKPALSAAPGTLSRLVCVITPTRTTTAPKGLSQQRG